MARCAIPAEVALVDGSLLKGSLRHRFLPAESAILGRLRIDLSSVESIAFEPDSAAAARVTFRNGDLVSAVLAPKHDHLVLDTLVGPLAIPLRAVASLAIASDATDALIYHCTFDSPSSITRPAAGPAGAFLGGEFVPGKVGSALRVFSDERAAQVDFRPGDLGPRGTIEFWAKMEEATPESRFGDGGSPRFFCLWLKDDMDRPGRNPRSSYLQWSGNDGSGRSGLCAMIAGATATTEPGCGFRRYPGFLGDPAAWHHYAVVWDADGVAGSDSVLALFVDGRRLASDGHDDLARGKNFLRFLETPVLLGFPQRTDDREPAARHVPFLIDEFRIWSAPKASFPQP